MKNKLFLLVLLISSTVFAQQATVKGAFLEKWENSKNYLVAMAEAMPQEHYNFKPTEREMSFQEQLIHIKGNMDWLSTTYFTDKKFDRSEKVTPTTKSEVVELVSSAFDRTMEIIANSSEEDLATTVDFFAGSKSKLQILNLLLDHVTHHRGQLVVYLNLNEIKPPRYVGW